MTSMTRSTPVPELPPLPVIDGMPIFYEDEEEGDMGESNLHVVSGGILHICLTAFLVSRPEYRVFHNLNCYYREGPPHPQTGSLPYVSPDIMVVQPTRELGNNVTSYTITADGPAPLLTTEVLSARSAQQRDLREKLTIYARLGIAEYVLVDITGRFLPERLLLKRLKRDRSWKDTQDADDGITSRLGFRIVIENDGQLRVIDATTGKRYARPEEAQAAVDALQQVEARNRVLEEELTRLRGSSSKQPKGKGRRRKS